MYTIISYFVSYYFVLCLSIDLFTSSFELRTARCFQRPETPTSTMWSQKATCMSKGGKQSLKRATKNAPRVANSEKLAAVTHHTCCYHQRKQKDVYASVFCCFRVNLDIAYLLWVM